MNKEFFISFQMPFYYFSALYRAQIATKSPLATHVYTFTTYPVTILRLDFRVTVC